MPSGERFGAAEISPGVWMPRLGLGTFKIRGEDATRSTLDALRSGCRHIDTASCYRNEEEVRLGIKPEPPTRQTGALPTRLTRRWHF